jgi:hypothetical protein
MNQKMERRHLEEAEEHIARGRAVIAAQERTIARLQQGSHDTALARALLDNLLIAQQNHIAHRALILRELG